jgi:CheY-like chemotaxis protein
MDLGLPGMDGLEASAAIKRNPETADIPIVALSARSEEASKEKALDAGVTMYLSKPAPPALIKETIERFINADSTAANPEDHCASAVVDPPHMPYAPL